MLPVQYDVQVFEEADGWRVVVRGEVRVWVAGPFGSADAARVAVWRLVQRWRRRARALGGEVWVPRGGVIAVRLPAPHAPRHALPFDPAPCAAVAPSVRSSEHNPHATRKDSHHADADHQG